MNKEMYRWLHGLFLGAALMVFLLQFTDVGRSEERFQRWKAVSEQMQAQSMRRPMDATESKQLSEKSSAILNESSQDPWLIRNLSRVGLFCIVAAMCVTMVEVRQKLRQRAELTS